MIVKIKGGVYYKKCEICGEYFRTKKSHIIRRKTCSKECDGVRKSKMYKGERNPNYGNRGELNPLYKGAFINQYGYRVLHKPQHPNANKDGYILEHRYVASNKIGRPLKDDEIVHHIDGNRLNNNPSNLQIMDRSEHSKLHNKDYEIIRDKLGRIVGKKRKEDD